ncbi:MAG: YicC/YloC family endoribonuclease [Planctomycetota bacterium]
MLSMTGFGKSVREEAGCRIEVEARSVNNRFLKLQLRTSRSLQAFEAEIESLVKEQIERGTVNLSVRMDAVETPASLSLNEGEVRRLHAQAQALANSLGLQAPTSLDAYLGITGVIGQNEHSEEFSAEALKALKDGVREAISELVDMRRHEGSKLKTELLKIAQNIETEVTSIASRALEVVEEQREKLRKRVNKILEDLGSANGITEETLHREIAILADRADIAEELQRLNSHLEQFHELLGEERVGRKLDFLLQEMLREANTIASKAADSTIARSVVTMKSELEKIREQAQNVE